MFQDLAGLVAIAWLCWAASETCEEVSVLQRKHLQQDVSLFVLVGNDLPHFLQGCKQIFLDVGANRGTHIRKLLEPQKYQKAPYLRIFDEIFGPAEYRSQASSKTGICAIGLEPNPRWLQTHQKIEEVYQQKGWKVKFLPVAAGDQTGVIAMYNSNESSKHSDWGFGVSQYGVKSEVQEQKFSDFVDLLNKTSPSGIRLIKMDIEGSEYKVMPDLLSRNMLCHNTIGNMTIEWHWKQAVRSKMQQEMAAHNCLFSRQTVVVPFDDESYLNDGQPL